MEFNEAILHALNGNALLFCGSGFSYGATTKDSTPLKIGSGLCKLLSEKLEIDDDDDLEYLSDKYKEKFGVDSLIGILKDNFTAFNYKEYHRIITNVDWRRIYTTNYDNVIEISSSEFKRKSITVEQEPRACKNHKELIIHLNGNIKSLNKDKFDNEFKLTSVSYLSESFINSKWYEVFKNDIDSVKAVFFVGFSLNYDLDIKRAISSRKGFKEKAFFIDIQDISTKSEDIISRFGNIQKIGVDGFAKRIEEISVDYEKPLYYREPLYSFSELSKDEPTYTRVADTNISHLLFFGDLSYDVLYHNRFREAYVFERDVVEKVKKAIEKDIKVMIIESDFGNGKTIAVNVIKYELLKYGTVFELLTSDEDYNRDIDNIVNNYHGSKFLIIENYHNYFKVLKALECYDMSNVYIILTIRSYINDLFYNDLLELNYFKEESATLITLNELSDVEINSLIKLLDQYNMWGSKFLNSTNEKRTYIKEECKKNLRNVLAGVLDSPVIRKKLEDIISPIKENVVSEKIFLLSLINSLVNLNLNLDDYLHLLSLTNLSSDISRNPELNEIIKIDDNEVIIKSSIFAEFIIKNGNYSDKIIDQLINIMYKLDNVATTDKYTNIQFSLISFSNIQLLIKEKNEAFNNLIIRYYESIKNLKYCNKNIFFWIQYANARISLKQFTEAKLCLENAEALKELRKTYHQYDTCYARFLLENQIYIKEVTNAYGVFAEAHNLIYNNKNKKDRWHFPLKHTILYYNYYEQFYETFSIEEKAMFILSCHKIHEKINDYLRAKESTDGKADYRVLNALSKIEMIINRSN